VAGRRMLRVEVRQARCLVWPGPPDAQDRCGPAGVAAQAARDSGGLRVRVRVLDKQATTAASAVPLLRASADCASDYLKKHIAVRYFQLSLSTCDSLKGLIWPARLCMAVRVTCVAGE
jgi:hypothetical protein